MVDPDEIAAVAENARLNLSDTERQEMADDLADILDAFESLDGIDTADVEPAFHPVEFDDGARPDEPDDCLTQDEALANTENKEDGYFTGPRAI